MKKVYVATVILYLCVSMICFFRSRTIYGAEILSITQDHFEFRDEPRVAEETLLGTLRAGTPVEWTGNTDGNWFEVRAPNGQVGWVHSSGISSPKSLSKPKAAPTQKQTTSRGTSRTTTSSTPLQKTVTELEKTNEQYKALLEEKDQRVGELTREIEELEQTLVETAQEINDTKQFQEMGQAELTDLQNEYDALKATLTQKDTELSTLQQEVNALQEKVGPTERILYGSNAFWFLLLSGIGIFLYIRHKKHGNVAIETEFGYEHRNYVTDKQRISPELKPHSPASATPAGTPPVSAPVIGSVEEEDVIIELSDVLPIPEQPIHEEQNAIEEVQDVEIVTDIEEIEEIQEVEEIEELSEADVIESVEEIEEIEDIEEVEDLGEVEELEEPEIIDDVEEIIEPKDIEELEEPEFIEEAEEITNVEELIEELGDADASEVELELIPDDLIEDVSEELPVGDTASLHEELEELEESLEGGGDFDYEAFYEELTGDASKTEEIPPQEASERIKVGGEEFEMLAEQSTQIIEEDEEAYEAEEYIEEIIEEVEEIEELSSETEYVSLAEEVAETAELLELRELESLEEPLEIVPEEIEEIFEVEEVEEFEPATEQPIPPSLLEPSPFLIEPEYEPSLEHEQRPISQQPAESKGPKYDIELVYVGKNKENIVELLSKIKGLTRSPQDLVNTIPSIIARGAKENDAKNFQVVMQKLGADVRLIKQ